MNKRCEIILKKLNNISEPVTASRLAEMLSVSRQVIVGDVAILRAAGYDIMATSKGYIINSSETGDKDKFDYTGIIACKHTREQLREELYIIVDYGATVIDVAVEHAIYGELSGRLDISSRYDVDQFIQKVEDAEDATPISTLTGGIHLHRLGCRSEEVFNMIRESLRLKGIAIEEQPEE